VALSDLLLGPAERADVIVDFSSLPVGTRITLLNLGPDEPFGGGAPGVDFPVSDPGTTGQVMQFRVVAATSPDVTTPPSELVLPPPAVIGAPTRVRRVSLNELDSETVCLNERERPVPCKSPAAVDAFGPASALLGTLDAGGFPVPTEWVDEITEDPALGSTEVWEIHNFTADAHPIHIHLVQFEVIDRQLLSTDGEGMAVAPATLVGAPLPPEPWETGRKDTVVVYPGQVTRVKAHYDVAGLFVWHCHILSHEDNEMMRPYRIAP
jgi:FtsP/CotA-like multicopper oxidase with cupredoxin domain